VLAWSAAKYLANTVDETWDDKESTQSRQQRNPSLEQIKKLA